MDTIHDALPGSLVELTRDIQKRLDQTRSYSQPNSVMQHVVDTKFITLTLQQKLRTPSGKVS